MLDTTDVLVALGLSTSRAGPRAADERTAPTGVDREVLDLFGAEPLDLERIVALTTRPLLHVL